MSLPRFPTGGSRNRFLMVLESKRPDGEYKYSPQEREHAYPFILLVFFGGAIAAELAEESEAIRNVLLSFFARLAEGGTEPETLTNDEDLSRVVLAYYRQFPLNPDLRRELDALLRELKLDLSDPTATRLAARKAFENTPVGPGAGPGAALRAPKGPGRSPNRSPPGVGSPKKR